MSPDILIIRDDEGYRLLHGHLHLIHKLTLAEDKQVYVDVKDEGTVKVVKTSAGLIVERKSQRLPLRQ
ncbi:hypothetical protein BH11PSE11_BH11PSE11_14210 [soil metagenome]